MTTKLEPYYYYNRAYSIPIGMMPPVLEKIRLTVLEVDIVPGVIQRCFWRYLRA